MGRRATTGVFMACTIVFLWGASLAFALGCTRAPTWPLKFHEVMLFLWLQFLYCGLFITAHDACHGSLAPGYPRLNKAFGWLCAGLYAGFRFDRLATKHRLHHQHVGTAADPDYYPDASNAMKPLPWAFRFFVTYLTWQQLAFMTALAQAFLYLGHVPQATLYLYWVGPALLSACQLFFFGTYLPHRIDRSKPFVDRYRARNLPFGRLLSLLSCYHFGYHHVHHARPHLPWFALPGGLKDTARTGIPVKPV